MASAGSGADTACALGRSADTTDGSVQAASGASTAARRTSRFTGLLRVGVGCPSAASYVPAIVTPRARWASGGATARSGRRTSAMRVAASAHISSSRLTVDWTDVLTSYLLNFEVTPAFF